MRNLDKYIDYVTAQLLEGDHSASEMRKDLEQRGLNQEEIDEVMDIAKSMCNNSLSDAQDSFVGEIIKSLILPVVVIILIWLLGGNVFETYSFSFVVMSFLASFIWRWKVYKKRKKINS